MVNLASFGAMCSKEWQAVVLNCKSDVSILNVASMQQQQQPQQQQQQQQQIFANPFLKEKRRFWKWYVEESTSFCLYFGFKQTNKVRILFRLLRKGSLGVNFTNILTRGFFVRNFHDELFCTYILGLNLFWQKKISTVITNRNVPSSSL